MLMTAAPIHVGVTYLETDHLETDRDVGNDSQGDRFIVSFVGGAANTELSELRIKTDKDSDGYSVGDLIFDTKAGGRGKEGFHDFKLIRTESTTGGQISANAEVADGGTELVIRLTGFKAGDRLEFTLDVDQILRMSSDIGVFNAALDTISSGQEFQDSILSATFKAPHFEVASADSIFINDYGDPRATFGLNLPPDNSTETDSRPNRTAAAVASTVQVPKPISIAGTVWVDDNLNLQREANEPTISGVQVSLWKRDSSGRFVDTGLKQTTDSNGRYSFGTSLGLQPGVYQVNQSQPAGFLSVGAVVGQVGSQSVGSVSGKDILTGIDIPFGDTQAVNYDFAEAKPAEVSGFVYRDDNDNGRKDEGEIGLSGVPVRLIPLDTIAPQAPIQVNTGADGSYSFSSLAPGRYEIIEVTQPANLTDGRESVGTISGQLVGVADEPGDAFRGVVLPSGGRGINYNFGELPLGSISGGVYLAAPGEDCGTHDDGRSSPIQGVVVELLSAAGVSIARTTTGLDGQYRFNNVPKGIYSIIEVTPAGLLDGFSHVGRIDGVQVGLSVNGGTIRDISLPAGKNGERYDFCEAAPGSLSGFVYHDRSNDGRRGTSEEPIANVTVELVNSNGTVVATTQTGTDGGYKFEGVIPGTYSIRETQPNGFLDGTDSPGTIAGTVVGSATNPGDLLTGVVLRQGQIGVDYNFGELRTASIAGRVHVDNDGDCVYDPDELLLSGVVIRLLDSSGRQVATTTTDTSGGYQFQGIAPGNYTVVEEQPSGYFEGGAKPGSGGGQVENPSRIGSITLTSGQVAVDYDFCERPPAEISGFVFVDRDSDCVFDSNERPLSGVRVDLINSTGRVVGTTITDASGAYRFTDLPEGSYTLRETQPIGFFQGGQTVGSGGGDASRDDIISSIPIGFGDRLTQYNFCEIEPSSLAGQVFIDSDEDCVPDPGEGRISNVEIQLYDQTGRLVATTRTDASGRYQFENLRPGQYRVVELHPAGFFSGNAIPGNGGGGRPDGPDAITEISVGPGTTLVEYNFCELLPGSISGSVWSETDLNRRFDEGDTTLAGVTVQLLNAAGQVIATQQTDAQGKYHFENLTPGTYAVRELQPTGLFHGGQIVGSAGGNGQTADLLANIVLPAGVHGINYDFAEFPPATISGNVFQDGEPITLANPPKPTELRQFRDGVYTVDDKAIGGVVLELRTGFGEAINGDRALPGTYPDGPIRVVTAADGSYSFTGLRPGSYHIYQIQPQDFIDSLDTPGTAGGVAINIVDIQNDPQALSLVQTLSANGNDPRADAILNISLVSGGISASNNFSEIVTIKPDDPAPPILPPPLPNNPAPVAPLLLFDRFPKVIGSGEILAVRPPLVADAEYAVTWHLSVINGGFPRGTGLKVDASRVVSAKDFGAEFVEGEHGNGKWMMVDLDGNRVELLSDVKLGDSEATPLSGDFNGDGIDEVAIFVAGQWFVDLNGNGKWDAGDLWLRLGNRLDRPVVGDWDGDGKDDIGIFGPQWQRDPEAIVRDLGLPDPDNQRRRNATQPVSNHKPIVDKPRYLRRGEEGAMRADAIDHVFRYGEQPDTPISGDWNGDGIDSIATFRAGEWLLDHDGDGRWVDSDAKIQFGEAGDEPIVGDWNGDGISDLGVIRGDVWIIDSDGDRRITGNDKQIQIAKPSQDAKPVVGDFDGDGTDELGWYDRAS